LSRQLGGDLERTTDRVLGLAQLVAAQAQSAHVPGDGRAVVAGEDRAQHGDAEGATHLPGGVVHGRAHTDLPGGQRAHDRLGDGRHRERHAGGTDGEAEQQAWVAVVDGHGGDDRQPGGTEEHPAADDQLGADVLHETGTEGCDEEHEQREREQA
jgi:hypothetical protein